MNHIDIRLSELSGLLPVDSVCELAWRVKESELVTGQPGRQFVVAGGDRPSYRVRIDPSGFEILRVDLDPLGAAPMHSSRPEFLEHPVVDAMACGRLYTTRLH